MPLVHRPRSTCITSWKRPPAGLTAPGAWARGTAPTSEARRTWSELWETSQRQSACSPCADFGIRERPRGHASGNAPRREILDRSGASASVNDALRHGSTIPTTALAATRGPPGTEPYGKNHGPGCGTWTLAKEEPNARPDPATVGASDATAIGHLRANGNPVGRVSRQPGALLAR